jgi:hypothetical protein
MGLRSRGLRSAAATDSLPRLGHALALAVPGPNPHTAEACDSAHHPRARHVTLRAHPIRSIPLLRILPRETPNTAVFAAEIALALLLPWKAASRTLSAARVVKNSVVLAASLQAGWP